MYFYPDVYSSASSTYNYRYFILLKLNLRVNRIEHQSGEMLIFRPYVFLLFGLCERTINLYKDKKGNYYSEWCKGNAGLPNYCGVKCGDQKVILRRIV